MFTFKEFKTNRGYKINKMGLSDKNAKIAILEANLILKSLKW